MNPDEIKILKARKISKRTTGQTEFIVAFPPTEGYFERTVIRDNERQVLCVHYHRVSKDEWIRQSGI